jgi:hypothetical protein
MSNRRGFLGLLAGGALAGPAAAKKVLEEAVVGRAVPTPNWGPVEQGGVNEWTLSDQRRQVAVQRLWELRHDAECEFMGEDRMPARIASKRSWSPTFKASEAARIMRELREMERKLRDGDDSLVEAFLSALGVKA